MARAELTEEGKKWCAIYVAISCFSNIGHGTVTTVVGPTQVYLARNVQVDIDTINLVWTFGFTGYFLGAFVTGMVFKRFMTSALAKVSYVGGCIALSGVLMAALPFIFNFNLLAVVRITQYFALGSFITADASMIVYTMGPVTSRPFTNALHAFVGVGFFAGTFLVRPFLPEDAAAKKSFEVVCGVNETSGADGTTATNEELPENDEDAGNEYVVEYMWGLQKISWPYIFSGAICLVGFFFYVTLGLLPLKMPRYYEDHEAAAALTGSRIHYWKLVVIGTTIYYILSCGIERVFQSMAYTYGLCGPLALSPSDAVITDTSYNGGFMAGRLVSIFIAKITRPRNIIVTACTGCLIAAILLCIFGDMNKYGLYACSAMTGFFVSWEFGAGYSWLAQKMDITGRLAPVSYFGCGIGSSLSPPLTGFVFTYFGKNSAMLYLVLIMCVMQCLTYSYMWTMARRKSHAYQECQTQELK